MLHGKKVLIGVCGGIAAYKIAILIRLLVKEGIEVKVIMTPSAKDFISPLTLSTLSKNPVYTEFYNLISGEWSNHVELGLWADAFIIAPTSANTLAKCAHGLSDNLLVATYLSARCPVFFAPAMDLDMYAHPSTQNNLNLLASFGNVIIEAQEGDLASGLSGKGRMSEPEQILSVLKSHLGGDPILKGKQVLVTAGPTYEALDPVRFIGNHSSGKMGYEIAESFSNKGAEVILVSGPTKLSISNPRIRLIKVTNAQEMYETALEHFPSSDIAVFAAAVADYKPKKVSNQKIKKQDKELLLELEKTIDIAKELGKIKSLNQFSVGFALKTENELVNAKLKIKTKNFDLIVLNSLNDKGAGFQVDTNKITLIDAHNKIEQFELKSKREVAEDIIEAIIHRLNDKV